jgi:transcriptional regulator with XRE-family HTH domain
MELERMKTNQPTLGALLKGLRSRNNWTLKEMSERTGIPFSTLSKVEHNRLTLSYDKLLQLSQRLNIRMSELFAEPDTTEQAITARRSVGRVEEAVNVKTQNYDYYYMCPELRRKRMIPIVTRMRSRNVADFGELIHHSGEEYTYVLEGRVEVHTEFYDPVVLETGESIYIDSNMGHAYLAAEGCEEAVVLGVCFSAEDNLMEALISVHAEDAEITPPQTTKRLSAVARPRARAGG